MKNKFTWRAGDYHDEIESLQNMLQNIEEDLEESHNHLDLSNFDGDVFEAEKYIESVYFKIEELNDLLKEFDNWIK
jgi:hypothetical protein